MTPFQDELLQAAGSVMWCDPSVNRFLAPYWPAMLGRPVAACGGRRGDFVGISHHSTDLQYSHSDLTQILLLLGYCLAVNSQPKLANDHKQLRIKQGYPDAC